MSTAEPSLLRPRGEEERSKVTFVELFFDLVFVFGITQLSHLLLAHFTFSGAIETALLLMAVWWVWIYTSWVTNWLDPERVAVRLMLFALMLGGLVLSTSIPEAFHSRGWAFAGAYVFMQVGRCLFTLWALKGTSPANYLNFLRITSWLSLAGVLWLAGAFAEGWTARLALWTAALLIEYVSPALGFWTPGLGRSTTADWDITGSHLAERCGLFIIIALGESILVTGAKFAELPWTAPTVAAFGVAFLGTVAMWWIYFNVGAEHASRRIARSSDPGRLGRLAYTYMHLPLVAGIVLAAVGDDLLLTEAAGHGGPGLAAVTLGGAGLYLAGNLMFKRATADRPASSHMMGLALLACLAPLSVWLPPLVLGAATASILVLVAVWETISLRRTAG